MWPISLGAFDLLPPRPLYQAVKFSLEHAQMAFATEDCRVHLPDPTESVAPEFQTNLHWSVRPPRRRPCARR